VSVWAVLQHVPFEGPGLIAAQAKARGLELERRHLYRGDAVPSLEELAGLVVLGGEVGPTGTTEVGIGSVALSPAGQRDGVLGPSGPVVPVLHWHEDTFTIPSGAELLAGSDRCVNQAFRVGRAYGLQFHVELDVGLAASMRDHLPADIALSAGDVASVESVGSSILGRFFDAAQRESLAQGA
jgi:hypothetical protein